MRNLKGVWVIVSLVALFLLPSTAFSRVLLQEGVHFKKANCPKGSHQDVQCIRLINQKGVDVEAQSLAQTFGLNDAFELRRQNPLATIPVCRDASRRGVWRMKTVKTRNDRISDEIWMNCPSIDRRVVTVPGELFKFDKTEQPPTQIELFDAAQRAVQTCGSNQSCFLNVFSPLIKRNGGGQGVQAPISTKPSEPPPPPPASKSEVRKDPAPSAPPASGAPSQGRGDPSSDRLRFAFGLSLLGLSFSVIAIVLLWSKIKRLQFQNSTLNGDLKDIEERHRALQAQSSESNTRFEASLEQTRTELTNARLDRMRLSEIVQGIATAFIPEIRLDIGAATSTRLVEMIETGLVKEIILHARLLYGVDDDLDQVSTREQAWGVLLSWESKMRQACVEVTSAIQRLVISESSGHAQNDPSGFVALRHLQESVVLYRDSLREELARVKVEFRQSDDLFTLLSSLISAKDRSQRANDVTNDEEGSGRHPVARDVRDGNDSEGESPPSSPTLTGLPAPPSEEAAPVHRLVVLSGGSSG